MRHVLQFPSTPPSKKIFIGSIRALRITDWELYYLNRQAAIVPSHRIVVEHTISRALAEASALQRARDLWPSPPWQSHDVVMTELNHRLLEQSLGSYLLFLVSTCVLQIPKKHHEQVYQTGGIIVLPAPSRFFAQAIEYANLLYVFRKRDRWCKHSVRTHAISPNLLRRIATPDVCVF